ncbi:crustapain-like [Culicoides brevitarsis]|uniref:crustapain-like n=1 Tax=Culicoides brevitarsis TaxID=469753 RepID=UPI00307C0E3D
MNLLFLLLLFTFLSRIRGNHREKVREALHHFGCDQTALKFLDCKDNDEEWNLFQKIFDKKYGDETTKTQRRKIFAEKAEKIRQNHKEFANGNVTYLLGFNKFSDLTDSEIKQFMGVKRKSLNFASWLGMLSKTKKISSFVANVGSSSSCNLREDHAIPVKDQKSCGACWAFSAIGVLEYIYYKNSQTYVDLSEQKTSDCARTLPSGCNGGLPEEAYKYYMSYGLPKESSAPYTATNTYANDYLRRTYYCYFANNAQVTTSTANAPNNWHILTPNTEENIKAALHKYGWLSVCVNANEWSTYQGGILTETASKKADVNHAVNLVGYGEETVNGKTTKFWLIRNSWGSSWGENGYIRIERDVGAFSIVQYASGTTYATSKNDKADFDFCKGKPYTNS